MGRRHRLDRIERMAERFGRLPELVLLDVLVRMEIGNELTHLCINIEMGPTKQELRQETRRLSVIVLFATLLPLGF